MNKRQRKKWFKKINKFHKRNDIQIVMSQEVYEKMKLYFEEK